MSTQNDNKEPLTIDNDNFISKSRKDIYKKDKKKGGKRWLGFLIGSALLLLITFLGKDFLVKEYRFAPGNEIGLEQFLEMPQLDAVVVDQGATTYNKGLKKFIGEHKGKHGIHTYHDEDTDTLYAYISGEKGMEPLTVLLYGIAESGKNSITVGYNFVEASPQFQDDIPTILIRLDDAFNKEINGHFVYEEGLETYQEVLDRYKGTEAPEEGSDTQEELTEPVRQEEVQGIFEESDITDEADVSIVEVEDLEGETPDNENNTDNTDGPIVIKNKKNKE